MLVRQNIDQIRDRRQQLIVVRFDLVPLHPGQLIQPQLEDLIHLRVREHIAIPLNTGLPANQNPQPLRRRCREVVSLQPLPRLIPIPTVPNDPNEVIQMPQRQQIRFQLLRLQLRLIQKEARPTNHHFPAMLNVTSNRIFDAQHPWTSAIDRQHVNAKAALQSRELIKVVQHHLRPRIPLQIHHHPRILIRLIAHRDNVRDDLLIRQLRNPLHQLRTVHVIRNLRDDDLLATIRLRDLRLTPHPHAAVPRLHVLPNPVHSMNHTTRREIRPFD